MALHQIERSVPLDADSMAVGLAALAGTLRQSPAQKPFAGDDLRDPDALEPNSGKNKMESYVLAGLKNLVAESPT